MNSQNLPSLLELESILDRAITFTGAFIGEGGDANPGGFQDILEVLRTIEARYVGRSVYVWGGETTLEGKLETFRTNAMSAHSQVSPDIILEACVFEIVTDEVNSIPIPQYVFNALGFQPENRNFSYQKMLFKDGYGLDHWNHNQSIPDFTRRETKLWFFYASSRYIDVGAEALHLGQVALMAKLDQDKSHTWQLLSAIRNYASVHARRNFVLCNAHIFSSEWKYNDTLLMDFHAFPCRPKTMQIITGTGEVPYRCSAGGKTVAGYEVDSLPYLVELDNWESSDDEITWYGHLPIPHRRIWLQNAVKWLKDQDPRGHFEMPGLRPMTNQDHDIPNWYYCNNNYWSDVDTILSIWSYPKNTLRAGEQLQLNSCLQSQNEQYQFWMQSDGNLVLYNAQGNAIWQTLPKLGAKKLVMQWDGNLVILDEHDQPLWSSGTGNQGPAYLLVQDDGNVVIYQPCSRPLWSTKGGLSI